MTLHLSNIRQRWRLKRPCDWCYQKTLSRPSAQEISLTGTHKHGKPFCPCDNHSEQQRLPWQCNSSSPIYLGDIIQLTVEAFFHTRVRQTLLHCLFSGHQKQKFQLISFSSSPHRKWKTICLVQILKNDMILKKKGEKLYRLLKKSSPSLRTHLCSELQQLLFIYTH